jgi:8-oxo-dGTP diphosphatase
MSAGHPVLAVGGVILDGARGEERVVLVKRARPPRLGAWSLPGGRVELGEKLDAALERELREETGLGVEVGTLLDVVEIVSLEAHYVVLDYLCRPLAGVLAAGDDASEARWVRASEIDAYGVTDAVRRVVELGISRAATRPL